MAKDMVILHEIPGRIRVHYPNLKLSQATSDRIFENLSKRNGIKTIRLEPRITTLTVTFDQDQLSADELIKILAVFQWYGDTILFSKSDPRAKQSFKRALHRSMTSGALLASSYTLRLLGRPSSMLDFLATIFTGYTVLSHGDREKGRSHHPDIITALVTSFAFGPNKMTEAALTSWFMNLLELGYDYQNIQAKTDFLAPAMTIELLPEAVSI